MHPTPKVRQRNVVDTNVTTLVVMFDEVVPSMLNVTKGAGPDGLPNILLKSFAATLCEPIAHIFNKHCSLASASQRGSCPTYVLFIIWDQGLKYIIIDPTVYNYQLLNCSKRLYYRNLPLSLKGSYQLGNTDPPAAVPQLRIYAQTSVRRLLIAKIKKIQ